MLKAEEVKRRVDIFDLADKLGLVQPGGKGNYNAPHRKEKTPSMTLYADGGWQDWGTDEKGSVIDLVMYVKGMEFIDALEYIHDLYGWEKETKKDNRTPQQKSLAENIADRSLTDPGPVIDYLVGRGIDKEIIEHGIKRKTIGWNTWTSDKPAGEIGHGGPAAAFIVRSMNPGKVMAVDMRYADPDLNGGNKTTCQGEKLNYPWFMDLHRLKSSKVVYVVESAINALSIESCKMKMTTAVATRGTKTIDSIDWRFLKGKKVIACMDNDKPNDKGHRPGTAAAWQLYDKLTALNIACHFVDQSDWSGFEYNDVNDIIQSEDASQLKMYLNRFEQWVIPGQPGKPDEVYGFCKPRVFLPPHDNAQYWRYRAKEDFTTYISKMETDEDGAEKIKFDDLCGFRVAAISRVNIQSATATMSGEEDNQPLTRFAVSVQIPRFGQQLQRKVFEDERLHNVDHWSKFGPIFARSQFLRMISIMERAADIGARDAVNFVGLAWRNGKPVVSEGPDCYFNEPEKQCPYHNLTFPSGSIMDAKAVIKGYQSTFKDNAASILLVWSLGGHLKSYLGFYPHMVLQASKGSGKSVLSKRLERTIAFQMFSGQSLQTEFRLLTSVSHTSHPVGWEELSARRQDVIDKAVSMLQECYQFGVTRRGSEMTEYLQCAPVLLAGEDVPVKSLTGKLVQTILSGDKQGAMMPLDMPRFPVREWLYFLAEQGRPAVVELLNKSREFLLTRCAGKHDDNGAKRMLENYAALLTTWKLLCTFARIETSTGNFISDLVSTMNLHISETSADREPWVWIMDTIFNEIESQRFNYPFKFLVYHHDGLPHECLLIRPKHIMAHISSSLALREVWNGLSVKTDRVLKQQLLASGVVFRERVDTSINKSKISHMMALSIDKLGEFNLHPGRPNDMTSEDSRNIDDGVNRGLF